MKHMQRPQQGLSGRTDIEMVIDLLLAESWLAKCEVVGRRLMVAPRLRALLQREANAALRRDDTDDAWLYLAHISLIEDIERRGVGAVQAEILRVLTCGQLERAAQLTLPTRDADG